MCKWRQEHRDFEQAYTESWKRGLLFYEKQLVRSVQQNSKPVSHALFLFALRAWFAKVYTLNESTESPKTGTLRLCDIHQSQDLLRLATPKRKR